MINKYLSRNIDKFNKIFTKKNYTINLFYRKKFSKISFAQSGEDLIIEYIFKLRGIENIFYIDIGAHHPFYLNNTALFYLKGCRGINIEANPSLLQKFIKYRPKDLNLNYGLSLMSHEEVDFYILSDSTLSTFSESEMQNCIKNNKYFLVDIIKVKTCNFSDLSDDYFEHKVPDLVSIDVEGLDFDILRSINLSIFRPKVICVESHNYSPIGAGSRRDEMLKYISSKDYYEYANTGLNSIFVDKSFWFI